MSAALALVALAALPIAATEEPPAEAVAAARATADRLGGELRGLLLDELKRGGPAAALEACAASAQRATEGVALASGHRVRRVSLRPRNPLNEPRPAERAVLVELDPLARSGAMPAERIWVESGEAGRELFYLRPIQAGAVCLGCHGPADRLSPEVRAGLARHYPGDRAVSYQEGDLRGAIVVRLPLGEPPAPPAAAPVPPPTPLGPLLSNPHLARPGLLAGGAPGAAEGFVALANDGYRTFVDLRGDAERPADAQALAEAAGLAYVRVPMTGEVDLDLVTARALDAVLDDPARGPLVVACHSGNRAAALLAVREFWLEGASAEAALALGKAAGLTRLEPSVRLLLGLPPAAPAVLAPAPTSSPTPAPGTVHR